MLDVMGHFPPQLLDAFCVLGKLCELFELGLNLLVLFAVLELMQLSLVDELLLKKLGVVLHGLLLVVCLALFPADIVATCCDTLQVDALRGVFCVFHNQLTDDLLLVVLLQLDDRLLPTVFTWRSSRHQDKPVRLLWLDMLLGYH